MDQGLYLFNAVWSLKKTLYTNHRDLDEDGERGVLILTLQHRNFSYLCYKGPSISSFKRNLRTLQPVRPLLCGSHRPRGAVWIRELGQGDCYLPLLVHRRHLYRQVQCLCSHQGHMLDSHGYFSLWLSSLTFSMSLTLIFKSIWSVFYLVDTYWFWSQRPESEPDCCSLAVWSWKAISFYGPRLLHLYNGDSNTHLSWWQRTGHSTTRHQKAPKARTPPPQNQPLRNTLIRHERRGTRLMEC